MKICDHLVIVVILVGKVVPPQKFMLFVVIVTTNLITICKYKSTKKRNRRNTQALIRALICII